MATLVLGIAGAAIGSSAGMTTLGFGIGTAIGSLLFAGNQANSAPQPQDGGLRFNDNLFQTSSYGAVIPVGYGLYRSAGNVIWSSPVEEDVEFIVTGEATGGKGLTGGTQQDLLRERRFLKASIAIGLGEVPLHRLEEIQRSVTSESQENGEEVVIRERSSFVAIRRLWLDSTLVIDDRSNQPDPPSDLTVVVELGDESQTPSSIIEAFEGVGNVPAYRGYCHVVIPELDLTPFGNRLPAATAEVYERMDRIDSLEEGVEGMCLDTEGFLWVCSHTLRVVQKINTESLEVVARVGRDTQDPDEYLGLLPAHPWRCAASPDGNYIWVCHKGDLKLTRISTADNSFVSFDTDKMYAMDVAVDNNNNVWVTWPFFNMVTKYNSSGVKQLDITINDAPWTIEWDNEYNVLWVGGNKQIHKIVGDVLTKSVTTGNFFHHDFGLGTRNSDLWCAAQGDDLAVLYDRDTDTKRRERNTGTLPLGVSSHPNDEFGTIYISSFSGNRLRAYSFQTRGQINAGTIAFPGPCQALPNGECFVSNTRLGIVQRLESR